MDGLSAHRPPATGPGGRRRRFVWLQWVAGVALLALLVAEGVYLWPRLHESWQALTEIHWGWVCVAVAGQAVSLTGYGGMQRQLLHAGGVSVTHARSTGTVFAATAMALTLPAGQVFATAFTYRQTRRWGASPLVASWQLAMSGVIAVAGFAAIGVTGALLVGGSVNPFMLILALAAVVALGWAARYAARHPDSIRWAAHAVVTRLNRLRHAPAEAGMTRVDAVLAQLDSVDLGRRDASLSVVWAVLHRAGDVATLAAACFAVGADPRLSGLLITYAVGKAVGTIPFAPGGLVLVDAALIATLTSAAGLPASQAVASAFVYRVVSFICVALVGWLVFLLMFRHRQHETLEYAVELERAELERAELDRLREHPGEL
ncbi:MAG TPA: YbhN family protein [Aldersonia sp.]